MRDQAYKQHEPPTEDELWGPGGRYDYATVTLAKRVRCFIAGHDVREWGTQFGWCHRCKHSIYNRWSRRSILYRGKWHTFPPAHKP
jgi:hypothetical protein